MDHKSLIRTSGIASLLFSAALMIMGFSLVSSQGFIPELSEPSTWSLILAILLLPLGLLYSLIPNDRMGKTLIRSNQLFIGTVVINLIIFGIFFAGHYLGEDVLTVVLLYVFIVVPASIITLVLSLILAFLSLKKSDTRQI